MAKQAWLKSVLPVVLSFFLFSSAAYAIFPLIALGMTATGFVLGVAADTVADKVVDRAIGSEIDKALDEIADYLGLDWLKDEEREALKQLQARLELIENDQVLRKEKLEQVFGGKDEIEGFQKIVNDIENHRQRIERLEKGYWMNGIALYGGYSERYNLGDVDLDNYSENFNFTTFGISYRRFNAMLDLEYTPHDDQETGVARLGDTTSVTGSYIFTQDTVFVPSAGAGLTYTNVEGGEDVSDLFLHGQLNFDLNHAVGVYGRVRYLVDEGEYEFGAGVQVPLSIGK